jgi:hypothetical protein
MFNSTTFDVVFGLVSVFLAISLLTSALTEAVSTIVGLRARTLLTGIKQLLNDPNLSGLALNLYNHALFNPLSSGTTKAGTTPAVKPSYIDPRQFAFALTDAIRLQIRPGPLIRRSPRSLIHKLRPLCRRCFSAQKAKQMRSTTSLPNGSTAR